MTPREITNAEIKKGDKLTYVPEIKTTHYIAESNYDNGVTLRLVSDDGYEYEPFRHTTTGVMPEDPVTLLEREEPEPLRVRDLTPGTKFTFLGDYDNDANYFQVANHEGTISHIVDGKVDTFAVNWIDPNDTDFTIINESEEDTITPITNTEANEAKLDLAVDFRLRAKFNYTNERGETADRRLAVQDFDGEYVGGESFDSSGYAEGYKRFRLDRINDNIIIR